MSNTCSLPGEVKASPPTVKILRMWTHSRIYHHNCPKAYTTWIDSKIRLSTLCRNLGSVKNARNILYVKVSMTKIAKLVRNVGICDKLVLCQIAEEKSSVFKL